LEIPLGKSAAQPKAVESLASFKGMRVLIIDDQESARETLCEITSELGMRPDAVASGESGLAAVVSADREDDPYLILLIDWKMPGMGGVDVVLQLKEVPLKTRPRFMMVSAYGDQLPREEAFRAGITRILAKPVTPSILVDALEASLHRPGPIEGLHFSEEIDRELRLRQGAHILLVEDSEINREVAIQMLRLVGMRVSVAENGRVAVDKVRDTTYDLILMDVQMPVMDGLKATEEIRSLPDRQSVPILAMTANAFDQDRVRCLEVGMNGHVAKPVEPEKLYRSLVEWLPARRVTDLEIDAAARAAEEQVLSGGRDLLAALNTVDGLDAAAGLDRLMNNLPRYVRLLRQFMDRHGNDAVLVAEQAAAGDLKAVVHTAHGLKGVAGLLGADGVERASFEIEKAARQAMPADGLMGHVEVLAADLRHLLTGLARVLPAEGNFTEAISVDWTKLGGVLDRLEPLLAADNTAANDLFEAHSALLRSAFGEAAESLGRQIQEFDYADALHTLRDARKHRFTEEGGDHESDKLE
jgi:CheY-like chemotaxis protein